MEKEMLIKTLSDIVGAEHVVTEKAAIQDAAKDYIGYRQFQRHSGNNMVNIGSCVVRPQSTEQVAEVLKFLNENKVDITPRAGGSSVTKSIEPEEGGVIIDCSDMTGIIEVNETDMYVTAKAGTSLDWMEKQLNEMGYTAGHFPQSLPLASLGGLVATRSIGQFSTLYGGIEDLLLGLEAVMPDGEVVRIKNVPRRSVGPDLKHLFIGSEGMTGYITEVTMKLFKYRPENRWLKAYGAHGMQTGLDFIRDFMQEGYRPAVVRLHDPVEVEHVIKLDAPPETALILLIAEGPKGVVDATAAGIEEIAAKYGLMDLGSKPVEHWFKTRNDVCHTYIDQPTYYNLGAVVDTCEISANWSVIGKIYDAVRARMIAEIDNLYLIGGHSSHSYVTGTNLYFEFAYIAKDHDPQAIEDEYFKVLSIIMEEVLRYGGSIAHHHGSGKYRTRWMPEEHGTSYPLMYKIKEALDPNGVMNKGVILVDKE